MTYHLKLRIDKAGVPKGSVLVEDVASLSQGLYDSVVRLIQHELGYAASERPGKEARSLSRLALTGVKQGSGILEYDLLPVQGLSFSQPPSVIAATSLVRGVEEYIKNGRWPKYLPPAVRRHLGASVARVLTDSTQLSIELYRDAELNADCRIDKLVKESLQEPESFAVQSPVQVTGVIYDINKDALAFRVDTGQGKVPVFIKPTQFSDVDKLRWQRVTVHGYPRDRKCSAVERMLDIRYATSEVGDGLVRPEEMAGLEATKAFTLSAQRVGELRVLENDWDSYEAIKPRKTTLDFALSFVRGLCSVFSSHEIEPPVPFIAPTRDGGVQLEWHVGERELELEIPEKGRFKYLWVSDDEESEGPISRWGAVRQVWRLVSEKDG